MSPSLSCKKTKFGWILSESFSHHHTQMQKAQCHLLHFQNDIFWFWEVEEIPLIKQLSEKEATCENHFTTHVKRDWDDRYIIAPPFNGNQESLWQSYRMALKRLQTLKRQFLTNQKFKEHYTAVLREYLAWRYMSRVLESHSKGVFLQNQAVLMETSMTTKVRVVFNASAESSTGISFNAALLAGPTIQDVIFHWHSAFNCTIIY